MKKFFILVALCLAVIVTVSFSTENLRTIYSRPSSQWPAPRVDGVWKELGVLPSSPIQPHLDSLKNIIELGKILFFDTRLSGSGKISCATCHQPELSWTDGKERSTGHEGTLTKRNSPTIQNTWFYHKLFWDGRARDLQDQAFAPINSETEMHSDMPDVMRKLRGIKAYKELFVKAFGDDAISPDRMTEAIASFEQTIVSAKSRFDKFLEGDKKALSNSELRGLHLFRTKAKCMNCHSGTLFSDNQFHHNGFFYPHQTENDKGLYMVSHKEEDRGKFKTPSLRDVTRTGPWMHDGSQSSLSDILVIYGKGGVIKSDPLINKVDLNKGEIKDLLAFLEAISSPPVEFTRPVLPE